MLDDAVAEVAGLIRLAKGNLPDAPREFLVALAVNDAIGSRLSVLRYWDLVKHRKRLPTGGDDGEIAALALEAGAGLCGQASSVAMELYERLGVDARQLDVITPDAGHTTVEVWYDGWHWFDPLFGYFYRSRDARPWEVYSLVQALWHSDAATIRVCNDARLDAQVIRGLGRGIRDGLDVKDAGAYRVTFHNGEEIYRR